MDIETRLRLIERNVVEVVTREELQRLLETEARPKAYLGYEPSGLFHIGWMIWANKVRDMVEAGVEFYLLEATWHAYINDKLGGDMERIRTASRYVKHSLRALGVPVDSIRFVDAEELASDPEYWGLVLRVAKSTTLHRVKRALTIMGRRADEAESDVSKLIYPLMQVADIFYLDLDIALGGLDQRRAHMLQREVAERLKRKKVVAVHTPLLTSLRGVGRAGGGGLKVEDLESLADLEAELKMSKSKPEHTILIHDPPHLIREKVMRAYCPPNETRFNPVVEIARYLVLAREGYGLSVRSRSGDVLSFGSYEKLEEAYARGEIHPADLKESVWRALAELLEPVRSYFRTNLEARRLAEEVATAQGAKVFWE